MVGTAGACPRAAIGKKAEVDDGICEVDVDVDVEVILVVLGRGERPVGIFFALYQSALVNKVEKHLAVSSFGVLKPSPFRKVALLPLLLDGVGEAPPSISPNKNCTNVPISCTIRRSLSLNLGFIN